MRNRAANLHLIKLISKQLFYFLSGFPVSQMSGNFPWLMKYFGNFQSLFAKKYLLMNTFVKPFLILWLSLTSGGLLTSGTSGDSLVWLKSTAKMILEVNICQKVISSPCRFLDSLKHEKRKFLKKGSLTISAICHFHPPMGYPYWWGRSGVWVLMSHFFDLCLDVGRHYGEGSRLHRPPLAPQWSIK